MIDSDTPTTALRQREERALTTMSQHVTLDVPGRVVVKVLLIAAVFSTSLFFTFRDSFVADEAPPEPLLTGESP